MTISGSNLPVIIRPWRAEDLPFILSAWSDSLLGHSNLLRQFFAGEERQEIARELGRAYRRRIHPVLEAGSAWVASHRSDPSILYGFVVCGRRLLPRSATVVHYLFTKEAFRGLGIARRLMEASGALEGPLVFATHWTRACEAYAATRPGFLEYRPSLFNPTSATKERAGNEGDRDPRGAIQGADPGLRDAKAQD